MSVYHWLVLLVLLFALVMHGERKGNTRYIIVAVILMFCVYGLRDVYTIGSDTTSSYLHHFEAMEDSEWNDLPKLKDWLSNENEEEGRNGHDRNVGFEWLMKLGYEWTDGDYQLFITIIAAFVMIILAQFLQRYSPSPVQSILYFLGLLFYAFHFSGLKQSIAMSVLLLSFNAIMDRKLIRFVLLVCIASLFHYPALVFLPAYWIGNMRLSRTYLIFLVTLFALTYFFRDQLVDWMRDTYDTTVDENSGMRFFANKVIVMIVIIVAAIVVRPPSPRDKLYSSLLMMMGVAAAIQTFAGYNNTFERLADYYFQLSIVFIPMIFENVETETQFLQPRMLSLIRNYGSYVFCAFAVWRYLNYMTEASFLNPFRFYFQADTMQDTLAVWLNLL